MPVNKYLEILRGLRLKKICAVICARKGSKRLEKKNIMLVDGKPLIAYTIETAIASDVFSNVIVNSEDGEILAVAERYGAESYLRPQDLASDTTFVIDVVKEMVENYHFEDKVIIGILFPTCPLRNIEDIHNAFKIYKESGCEFPVVSVSPYEYPIHVALDITPDNRLKPIYRDDYKRSTRHNDHKKMYHANYAVIFNNVGNLKRQNNLIGDSPIPYIMPPERSIDIDEPFQMKIVQALMLYNRMAP
jgi:CMP-N-acetylneuraminic acid synthetase